MKYYNVLPNNKEDLINSTFRCPWCKAKIRINEHGFSHTKGNHKISMSLEEIYDIKLKQIENLKKLLYGRENYFLSR